MANSAPDEDEKVSISLEGLQAPDQRQSDQVPTGPGIIFFLAIPVAWIIYAADLGWAVRTLHPTIASVTVAWALMASYVFMLTWLRLTRRSGHNPLLSHLASILMFLSALQGAATAFRLSAWIFLVPAAALALAAAYSLMRSTQIHGDKAVD